MQYTFLSHMEAAVRNRNNLLHYVKKSGPISRTDIWKRLDISRASVTQLVQQLQSQNLIIETGRSKSGSGRKQRYIEFNGASHKMFAFDWTSRMFYLTNLSGEVLYEKALSFDRLPQPGEFADALVAEAGHVTEMGLYAPEELQGIVLALPGLINCETASLLYSAKLHWQNVDIAQLFCNRIPGKVYIERTGNIMMLGVYNSGESWKESHFQLFIMDADGIGVSAIVRGHCQHGMNFMYGELGHIKLHSSVPCSCGQHGCLEAVISDLFERSGGRITPEILDHLANAVSTTINISDVGEAILVGSYIDMLTREQSDALVERIRGQVTCLQQRNLKIQCAHNSRQLACAGLSAYAFDRLFPVG